jgi:polyvinyl alcohol dehydrogenase (cytochrome)
MMLKLAPTRIALTLTWCLIALTNLVAIAPAFAQAVSGEALYKRRCAACHDNADGRTPPREALRNMTPSRIMRTLDFGAMMTVAYTLTRAEREAVAQFLGKPGAEPAPLPSAYCASRSARVSATTGAVWNGWSALPDNARFTPAPVAKLDAAQVPNLKVKWAFGFEGDISAFAQPTVIGGQVFVGSAGGVVHALRADTGCLQWTFQATGPIR